MIPVFSPWVFRGRSGQLWEAFTCPSWNDFRSEEVEFLRAPARPPRREGGIEADGDPACNDSGPASVRGRVLGLLLALASLSFRLRGSRGLGARDGGIQLDRLLPAPSASAWRSV